MGWFRLKRLGVFLFILASFTAASSAVYASDSDCDKNLSSSENSPKNLPKSLNASLNESLGELSPPTKKSWWANFKFRFFLQSRLRKESQSYFRLDLEQFLKYANPKDQRMFLNFVDNSLYDLRKTTIALRFQVLRLLIEYTKSTEAEVRLRALVHLWNHRYLMDEKLRENTFTSLMKEAFANNNSKLSELVADSLAAPIYVDELANEMNKIHNILAQFVLASTNPVSTEKNNHSVNELLKQPVYGPNAYTADEFIITLLFMPLLSPNKKAMHLDNHFRVELMSMFASLGSARYTEAKKMLVNFYGKFGSPLLRFWAKHTGSLYDEAFEVSKLGELKNILKESDSGYHSILGPGLITVMFQWYNSAKQLTEEDLDFLVEYASLMNDKLSYLFDPNIYQFIEIIIDRYVDAAQQQGIDPRAKLFHWFEKLCSTGSISAKADACLGLIGFYNDIENIPGLEEEAHASDLELKEQKAIDSFVVGAAGLLKRFSYKPEPKKMIRLLSGIKLLVENDKVQPSAVRPMIVRHKEDFPENLTLFQHVLNYLNEKDPPELADKHELDEAKFQQAFQDYLDKKTP